jgi:hypothetical protein
VARAFSMYDDDAIGEIPTASLERESWGCNTDQVAGKQLRSAQDSRSPVCRLLDDMIHSSSSTRTTESGWSVS